MTTPLARLVRLAPPSLTPAPTDWPRAESRLGRALPRDYKELVDSYGVGMFDGHIYLLVPETSVAGADLVEHNDGRMAYIEEVWEDHGNRPPELQEDGTSLITWATTVDADDLCWLVRPGSKPDDWTVVVLNDDLTVYEHFPMTCTNFLAALFAEEIESEILSPQLAPEDHTFDPMGASE
jgi:hypothetical protein